MKSVPKMALDKLNKRTLLIEIDVINAMIYKVDDGIVTRFSSINKPPH